MLLQDETEYKSTYYFDKVDDFLKFILFSHFEKDNSGFNFLDNCIFRGVGRSDYTLRPTALRTESTKITLSDQILKEAYYLYLFYKHCNKTGLELPVNIDISDIYFTDSNYTKKWYSEGTDLWLDDKILDLASLAQHHGVPTRLLDWTMDVYIAVYFAATSALKHKEKEQNGRFSIYCLNIKCLESINSKLDNKIPLKIIIPSYAKNKNINVQKGLLTTWQINLKNTYERDMWLNPFFERDMSELLVEYLDCITPKNEIGKILFKFELPYSEIDKSLQILNESGYNTSVIFPGYDGVARYIKELKGIPITNSFSGKTFFLS